MASGLFRARCRMPDCSWPGASADTSEGAAAMFEEHYQDEHQDVQAAIRRHPAKGGA